MKLVHLPDTDSQRAMTAMAAISRATRIMGSSRVLGTCLTTPVMPLQRKKSESLPARSGQNGFIHLPHPRLSCVDSHLPKSSAGESAIQAPEVRPVQIHQRDIWGIPVRRRRANGINGRKYGIRMGGTPGLIRAAPRCPAARWSRHNQYNSRHSDISCRHRNSQLAMPTFCLM